MSALMARHPLWALTLPALVWAAHFLAVYAFAALVCVSSVAQRQHVVAIATGVATAIALALIAAAAAAAWRSRRAHVTRSEDDGLPAFVATGALVSAMLAGIGVAWVAAPAFVLPPCLP